MAPNEPYSENLLKLRVVIFLSNIVPFVLFFQLSRFLGMVFSEQANVIWSPGDEGGRDGGWTLPFSLRAAIL